MRLGNDILDARGRVRVQTLNDLPSETVQSDAPAASIREILKQYAVGGMGSLDGVEAFYADISEFVDYKDALDNAKAAEVDFLKLPSKVREIFDHDVAVWLDTAHDEDKRDALVAGGFLKARLTPSGEAGPETPRERRAEKGASGEAEDAGGIDDPSGEVEVT